MIIVLPAVLSCGHFDAFCMVQASGWVAASRLICCWTPEETRGASLGSLAFAARVS